MSTTLLETCRIPPPPPANELSVPLTFFDIKWLHFHPLRRLLFYNHPCTKPHFLDAIVPQLKQSLSLTLKHYLPVAGNLLYPSNNDQMPKLRYVPGDSVPLTIAESSSDFDSLTGNHARDADQFYDFVPPMPPIEEEFECKVVPIFAMQVTLFPGRGICIGLSNHHCLGDARSIVGFMYAWGSINKFGGDEEFLSENGESLPTFDRSYIKDPLEIDSSFWNVLKKIPLKPSSFPLPTNRVRATFILSQSDIRKLKDMVNSSEKFKQGLVHASSFVVAAAYVWSCMVKSGHDVGEEAEGNAPELFIIPADARGRTNPPVPANYFGNCIVGGVAKVEHGKVAGDDGFVIAAAAIAEEIKNKMNDKEKILKGAENWLSDIWKCFGMSVLGISGSPKFDLLNADFGWGKAGKLEVVSIDGEKYSMSLCSSRDSDGGLEVGLSLPRERMEAFATIFVHGLTMSYTTT